MIEFLSYISLFLLIFDITIPPFGGGIGSAPFAILLSLFSIAIVSDKKNIYKRFSTILLEFKPVLLLYLLINIYSLFRMILVKDGNPLFITSLLRADIFLISTITYLISFNQNDLPKKILNVFFFNAIIALTIGSFPQYQYLVDFFKISSEELIGYNPYRNAFLAGSGYFGIGAPYALVTGFYLLYLSTYSYTNNYINYIKLLVIAVAGILAARTAVLAIGLAVIYLLVYKRDPKTIMGIIFLLSLLYFILNLEFFAAYKDWLSEVFNPKESSTVETLTTDFLVIPTNSITFIFGDGKYTNFDGSYYMYTDIGYMRHWYFGGIIYMLSIVSIPLLLYFKNLNKHFLFLIVPIVLVLHFKGVFIFGSPIGMPLLFLISHILYQRRLAKKSNIAK